jgi:putative ABC transport system permease protein
VRDVRFALRLFRCRPGFAILATVTLALGIGATTAVYTIVRAVLLRPLPYRDPGRLVLIWDNAPRDGDQVRQILAPRLDFEEYRRSARLIESVSLAGRTRPVLRRGGVAQSRLAGVVTLSMLRETLGVEAGLGRVFTPDDERGGCSVVLAHRFWSGVLGADKSIVGSALNLDNTPCRVLGVMPPEFVFFPTTPDPADMWFLDGHDSTGAKEIGFGAVCVRLKPGVTKKQALAEIAALHAAVNAGRPKDGDGVPGLVPAMDSVQEELTFLTAPTLRKSLLLTFASVSLLLFIACLNTADLLLARLTERSRELVVRAALGSGRARLIRQMLIEGLLLALGGAVTGILLAAGCVYLFRKLNPIALPPHAGAVGVDFPVLMFAVFLSAVTTLAFALPGIDLSQSLKVSGRGFFGATHRRAAQTIVAGQIAVSFTLAAGANLLMTSVLHLGAEQLGFDPRWVVSMRVNLPASSYPKPEDRNRFRASLLEKLGAMPGVKSVAFGFAPPWNPHDNIVDARIEIQGDASNGLDAPQVEPSTASPSLFETLRTPLLEGRFFDARDTSGAPRVAIINQKLAADHFGSQDPIGRRIRFTVVDQPSQWITIIGVVGNWKHMVNDAIWRDTPMVFFPVAQDPGGQSFLVTVRAEGDPRPLGPEIRKTVTALDGSVETNEPELLSDRLSKSLLYPRFRAALLVWFGLSALLLAAVGLHGVLAQLIAQRMPEFGVRRAVGAQTWDLVSLVARQGGTPVAAGLIGGIALTLAMSRALQSMLYGIRPADPSILILTALALAAVASVAIALPARRAARVEPTAALREE